jgi:hypothetical protein
MGSPQPPSPVKLVAGLLAASDALLAEAAVALSNCWGAVDAHTVPVSWTASSYYCDEMGADLRRQFISFERLVAPGKLAGIKQMTNALEGTWTINGCRRVNLDPGYVGASKLVLASTKDAAPRVYLSGGIYAEVALVFHAGTFHAGAHTYPDYAAAETRGFFTRVRSRYLAQLRALP